MRWCLALALVAATCVAAEPLKLNPGEKQVGSEIQVTDKDGSIYHVPSDRPEVLEAVRLRITRGNATPMPATCPTCPKLVPGNCAACAALDEVNALRASRGLPAFIHDPMLTQAAEACASFRASNLIAGHTSNDFKFVPSGGQASSAGCAAWPPSLGWGSCCVYDRYTYAGAGWAMGRDNKRYMHLFVR